MARDMRVGIEPIDLRSKKSGSKEKAIKPECLNRNEQRRDCKPSIITVENILAASTKLKEGSVRCCDECGEGHCCDGREKEPRFVGIDYTRD